MKPMNYTTRTAFLSCVHFLVDFSCALILFSRFYGEGNWAISLLVYNFCAFALQLPMGILADYFGKANRFSALGCVLVAAGFVLPSLMSTAIVIGIGNGLFHVGGGVEVMRGAPRKATPLGIFVAPGAIGLYLGTILGKRTAMFSVPVALVLVACALVCLLLASKQEEQTEENAPWSILILAAMFLVVVLRSMSGLFMAFSWKTGVFALLAVVCTAGGKACGGIVSDRWGIRLSAAVSLLLSAVLFLLGEYALAGLCAIFLFNMTMPMTLYSLCTRYRASCGAMFGLLTLALFVGFLPQYLGLHLPGEGGLWLCVLALVSLLILVPAAGRRQRVGK
ncbi:MAG: MFS transporter [Ruminococcaceae bacterium]|nr:MFS transporter [Oscillospiraceae bacterium]